MLYVCLAPIFRCFMSRGMDLIIWLEVEVGGRGGDPVNLGRKSFQIGS